MTEFKGYTRRQIQRENELYKVVIEEAERCKRKLEENQMQQALSWTDSEDSCLERDLGGRRLYLVGETHLSRKPIDYIHNHLVGKIAQDPQSWLLLREGVDNVRSEGPRRVTCADFPIIYFAGLEQIFNVPLEDALANLSNPETQFYLVYHAGITREDIDRFNFEIGLLLHQEEARKRGKEGFMDYLVNVLGKPREYIRKQMILGLSGEVKSFFMGEEGPKNRETLYKHWDDMSRIRFHKLLEKYSDKRNVLINVGKDHLHVFE